MNATETIDPIKHIENADMTWRQYLVIGIGIFISALDGFDMLSISFAAPGIAQEWGIGKDTLGLLLSMEMVGIGVGAIFLGRFADRFGRKTLILFCLCLMSIGMFLGALAPGLIYLCVFRVLTGFGIGGMFTAISAMAAETSNLRNRSMVVAFTTGGIALGSFCGGIIASSLLKTGIWRDVFEFGAIWSLVAIPLVVFFVPESVGFIIRSNKQNALIRVNKSLKTLGFANISKLPETQQGTSKPMSWGSVLAPSYRLITLTLTMAFFCFSMTMYFYFKWIPKIGVDLGFSASDAGSIFVWGSAGGLVGTAIFSVLSRYVTLRPLLITTLIGSAIGVAGFGFVGPDLLMLKLVSMVGNFFVGSTSVMFYAFLASAYPIELRTTGMGFILGIARAGAALGPYLAGVLFSSGASLALTTTTMASAALIAALLILFLLKNRLDNAT